MGTLRVRNLRQKILWEQELTGQLSDGRWENSRPMDHWQPWCDATVVVDEANVGRDFYARRDGYCFTERDLLDAVGDRMLEYVRIGMGDPDYSVKDMLADLRDLRKLIKLRVAPDLPIPPQPEGRREEHKIHVFGPGRAFTEELTVYTPAPPASPAPPERTYTFADFDTATP